MKRKLFLAVSLSILIASACNKSQESEQEAPKPPIQTQEVTEPVIQEQQSQHVAIQEIKPTEAYIPEINKLIWTPWENIGESREAIKTKLGQWISLETRKVENIHDPDEFDNIYTIKYNGLIFTIYHASAQEMLMRLKMSRNYPEILPELIGLERKVIESRYGPTQIVANKWKYRVVDVAESKAYVSFNFEDDLVRSVEWDLYFD